MAMLSSPGMYADKRSQSIYETRWLSITVISGQAYSADRFLDRQARFLDEPHGAYWFRNYDRLPEPVHQLTAYVLAGVDPNTGRPAKESPREHDVFVHRDESGAVTSFITCGNVPHAAARCKQEWSLEREGVHAAISASYRRGLLPHWQDIQANVSQVLLSFKATAEPVQSATSIQH